MSIRDSYAATFGEDQADALQAAGDEHRAGILEGDKFGSDPFRDAFVLAIGFECFTSPSYRECHGITADIDAIKAWAREHGRLSEHDGPKDYIALFIGMYNEYVVLPN